MAGLYAKEPKNLFKPKGVFVNWEGYPNEANVTMSFTDALRVGDHLVAGAHEDTLRFGYKEIDESIWRGWYYHGYKVTGAYTRDYAADDSYGDQTMLLWVNTFSYHPEHDLLPVAPYKIIQWGD